IRLSFARHPPPGKGKAKKRRKQSPPNEKKKELGTMSDYRLGVLGGMGPQATNTFYQYIIDRTAARTDQEHISMLIFSDNEVPDRTAAILSGEENPVYDRLLYGAKLLEQGGCTAIAVPCNTAHYFLDKVQEQISIPILHMVREACQVLASR